VKHRAMDVADKEPDTGDEEHYTPAEMAKLSEEAALTKAANISKMKTLDKCCTSLVLMFFVLCGFVYCWPRSGHGGIYKNFHGNFTRISERAACILVTV
jgi:hypothetical protein